MGPMTGRGAGYCNDFTTPGFAHPTGFPVGFGCGFGLGYGRRNMFRATGMPGRRYYGYPEYSGPSEAAFDEKAFLNNQAEILENQLQQLKQRLSNLNEEKE